MPTSLRAACIIGWPVRQSRSPKLHGFWLKALGIDGAYRAEERRPEEFADFVRHLSAHGYVGANVTMPHKDAAFGLSEADACARAVGAANTLWLAGDRLCSTNTDVEGFVAALDERAPGWAERGGRTVVLGAGGAGRAIVYGLLSRGVRAITIVNRSRDKADDLCARFGSDVVAADWADLPRALAGATLLVNGTSLGMTGKDPLVLDISQMHARAIVADVVNVPLVTPLLAAAQARGFVTSNGLDMLMHQGVRGFELWFGVRPRVTADLRAMLEDDIRRG